jgi:hypothetical protein
LLSPTILKKAIKNVIVVLKDGGEIQEEPGLSIQPNHNNTWSGEDAQHKYTFFPTIKVAWRSQNITKFTIIIAQWIQINRFCLANGSIQSNPWHHLNRLARSRESTILAIPNPLQHPGMIYHK